MQHGGARTRPERILQIFEILTAALFSPETSLNEDAKLKFGRLLAFATSAIDNRWEIFSTSKILSNPTYSLNSIS